MKTLEERLMDPNEEFTNQEIESFGISFKDTLLTCATVVMNLEKEYKYNLEKLQELKLNKLLAVIK